jgi:hypothetical protein
MGWVVVDGDSVAVGYEPEPCTCRTFSIRSDDELGSLSWGILVAHGCGNCSHTAQKPVLHLMGLQQHLVEAFCCPNPLPVSTFAPGLFEVYD